jgi:hypothetical protein
MIPGSTPTPGQIVTIALRVMLKKHSRRHHQHPAQLEAVQDILGAALIDGTDTTTVTTMLLVQRCQR